MTNSNPDAINVLWLLFDVIILSLRPCLIIATNTKNDKKNKTNNNNSNNKCRQPDGPKISCVLWWIVQNAYHLAIECIVVTTGEKRLYTKILNVQYNIAEIYCQAILASKWAGQWWVNENFVIDFGLSAIVMRVRIERFVKFVKKYYVVEYKAFVSFVKVEF